MLHLIFYILSWAFVIIMIGGLIATMFAIIWPLIQMIVYIITFGHWGSMSGFDGDLPDEINDMMW